MNLLDIKNSIANILQTNQLIKQANSIKLNARDGVGRRAERAAEIYDGKIQAPEIKQFLTELKRQNRAVNPDEFFAQIAKACTIITAESESLENFLSDDARQIIMRETLNIKDAQILEFLAVSDFFLNTARTLMVAVAEFEIAKLRGSAMDTASLKYWSVNITKEVVLGFANSLAFFLNHDKGDVIEKIYDLPDIRVDKDILETVQSTEGRNKIDPVGLNLLNIINPIAWMYSAQKAWSEFKLYRLELNTDELEYLELRYQELLLERQDRSNPDMEKKIKLYMDTIQIKRTKIERIRKTLG